MITWQGDFVHFYALGRPDFELDLFRLAPNNALGVADLPQLREGAGPIAPEDPADHMRGT